MTTGSTINKDALQTYFKPSKLSVVTQDVGPLGLAVNKCVVVVYTAATSGACRQSRYG